eukprot:6175256-Pleurochrysis_carterae.AAC.3
MRSSRPRFSRRYRYHQLDGNLSLTSRTRSKSTDWLQLALRQVPDIDEAAAACSVLSQACARIWKPSE